MSDVTIKIPKQEMDKFQKWADTQNQEVRRNGRIIIEGTIRQIERQAKLYAPRSRDTRKYNKVGTKLASGIHSQINNDGLGGSVYSNANYSAYREWGTGDYVQVPTFVKEMFGVNSMDWKGKGIRKINSLPQPFLFEPARVNFNNMISKLENLGFKKKDERPK
jgi:hypothetical protein